SEQDLCQLVEKSAGSFIFAFTLVNFVNDGSDLPHRKLDKALENHFGLDPLYTEIVRAASGSPNFRRVLGTIFTVVEQFSITDLACLLQIEAGDVILALQGVQSIIIVPADNNGPVRPFHTSLRDFLTTRSRSDDFFINPPRSHLITALDCLTAMTAYVGNDIYASHGQQYAALHWFYHLCSAINSGSGHDLLRHYEMEVIDKLTSFLYRSFDSWVNSIIILWKIEDVLSALSTLKSALEVSCLGYMFCVEWSDSPGMAE